MERDHTQELVCPLESELGEGWHSELLGKRSSQNMGTVLWKNTW
jgi:hypothetical protein